MKVFAIGILVILAGTQLSARNIPANDSRVQYWGRVSAANAPRVTFDWPGTCILFNFTGTSCAIKIGGANQFNVIVDGIARQKVILSSNTSTKITLVSGLAAGQHSMIISKRSESSWNTSTIDSIIVDNTADLASPPALPSRRIEYIGDSHTVGYANEYNSRSATNKDSILFHCTNSWLSFGPRVARTFGAQFYMEAISGVALAQGGGHLFPEYYGNTLVSPLNAGGISPAWNFAAWIPNVVVISLGINDAGNQGDSASLVAGYRGLISTIRTRYGNPVIICMASTQAGAEMVAPAVKQVVKSDSLLGKPIGYCQYSVALSSLDWHPSVSEDSSIAVILANRIARATGWSTTPVRNSVPKTAMPAITAGGLFTPASSGMVSVKVMDLSGRTVSKTNVPVVAGRSYSATDLKLKIANAGLYLVQISGMDAVSDLHTVKLYIRL